MRNPLNQLTKELPVSGIRRFFGMAASIPDVISLGVGEPDFETPWHVKEKAIQSIRKGQTFYTANAGLIELRQGIANFVDRHYGLKYAPENEILVTVGCSEAIDLAFRVMLDRGDEVIVIEPSYVSYAPTILLAGGVPVPLPLKEENGFKLTAEELESAITPKTKIVVICYPNNPTGAIMEKEELEAIAHVIKKHDLFVISDEVYSELTYNDKGHFSIGALDGMKERSIILNGFSKAFAMTGWRLGYALAPQLIIDEMTKIHAYTAIAPTSFVQYAAIAAINDSDDDIVMMKASYNERRRYLLHRLKEMGIQSFEPKGAFYLFVNISQFGLSSEEFCQRLLHEQKLAIVPGASFGDSGEGFVRISYAYSLQQLEEAMLRLEQFVNTLKKSLD